MTSSEIYYKKAKDAIRKSEGLSVEETLGNIRDTLFHYLGDLPDNLKYDIFNFYLEQWSNKDESERSFYDFAEAPLKLIDFMGGVAPADDVEFSDEEWAMIRDGINANADSMDLRLLNQLMTVLVEKKKY